MSKSLKEKSICYVYLHINPKTGLTFYVGIGSNNIKFKRAYSDRNRNYHWKNTVKKYGVEVQIIKNNISRDEAIDIEKALISWFGRRDLGTGCLVNMTEGGDGIRELSQESIEKIRLKNTGSPGLSGKDNPMFGLFGKDNPNYGSKRTKEQKKNISDSLKGKQAGENNPMWGIRGKDNPNYGRKVSQETREKLRKYRKGTPLSEETKEKLKGPRESLQRGNHPSAVIILCQKTGIFYECIKDACEANEINYSTLRCWLNPNCKSNNKSSLIKV